MVKNFKSYKKTYNFDFSKQDLIILDGPNGFGKTTIFDAIEIALTGTVSRFKDSKNIDTKTRTKNMLISTNGVQGDPAWVVLELIDNNASMIIGTYIEAKKGQNKEWSNHIFRNVLKCWPDNLNDLTAEIKDGNKDITEQLQKTLDYKEINKMFTVFNYIQQEESLHFLKLDEKSRFKQLDHLFGIEEEKKALAQLENLKSAVSSKLASLKDEKSEKEIQLKSINIGNSDTNIVTLSGNTIKFRDTEKLTIENLKKYKTALLKCKYILSDEGKTNWPLIKLRYQIRSLLKPDNKQLIKSLLLFSKTPDFSHIESLSKHILWVSHTIDKCNDYRELKQLDACEDIIVSDELLNKIKRYFPRLYNANEAHINNYNTLVKTQNTTEKLLTSITNSSETLIKKLNQYYGHKGEVDEHTNHTEVDCPLCGQTYVDLFELNNSYKKQKDLFETILTDTDKEIKLSYNKILDELISSVILRSYKRYSKYSNFDKDYKEALRERQISKSSFDQMLIIKEWFDNNLSKYSEYTCQSLFLVHYPAENKYLDIRKELETLDSELSIKVNDDFEIIKDALDFIGIDAHIEVSDWTFSIDNVNNDILFIENQISIRDNIEYKKLAQQIVDCDKDLNNFENILTALTDGYDIYKDRISRHEKEIAKKIQIPFYNISSKILQTRLESGVPASGIILEAPDKLNNNGYYRFCSSFNNEHDAWSTMSSGQLAGVIISFMLAMNKVFPTGLKMLLIDDPIQSMDDINMASFIQLLREEFVDYQIIMSTHESRIANYISYKYKSSGLNSLAINLKSEKKKEAI